MQNSSDARRNTALGLVSLAEKLHISDSLMTFLAERSNIPPTINIGNYTIYPEKHAKKWFKQRQAMLEAAKVKKVDNPDEYLKKVKRDIARKQHANEQKGD